MLTTLTDENSIFSRITSPAISSSNRNEGLLKIIQWVYQWKMSFNPDITKEAQEIIFSKMKANTSHPSFYFDKARIQLQSVQKHLGFF